MLTGDNPNHRHAPSQARSASSERHVIAGVRPERKADEIAKLQAQGYTVAMVGDGIDDAARPRPSQRRIRQIGTGTDVGHPVRRRDTDGRLADGTRCTRST